MLKWIFECADLYAKNSTWKDFAAVKICLLGLGIAIGIWIPDGAVKNVVFAVAAIVFVAFYIPLITKFFKILKANRRKV